MAATQSASVPMNLEFHFSNIINKYMGRESTHIKVMKTLDGTGYVISESQTESIIYGAIGTVNQDVVNESLGMIKTGDLMAYFMESQDVLVGEQITEGEIRIDYIEYECVLYSVVQRLKTAYDNGTEIVSKYVLRKVAYE